MPRYDARAPVPVFPTPGHRYDPLNEAQFRQAVERFMQEVADAAATTIIEGGGGGAGILAARNIATITTASIAAGGDEQGTVALGSRTALLINIEADKACRVRLYANSADRSSDYLRDRSTDPTAGQGVFCEFIFSTMQDFHVSPPVVLYNEDAPVPANVIYYTIENDDLGSAQVITVDLTHLDMEPTV